MSKHTPGPWYLEEPNLKKQRVDISTGEACPTTGAESWRGLARVYGCVDYPESGTVAMMANARMIAAAPELMESHEPDREGADFLDWIADRLVYQYGESPNTDFILCLRRRAEKARAAIAKATGEPK